MLHLARCCGLAAIVFSLTSMAHAATLVIGQVAPLSGPLAPTGSHMRAGAQLYFEQVNAAGGVHGNKLRLESRDDGYKTEETVKQARALIKEVHPLAMIGVVGTGNVEALTKENVLADEGLPLIGMRSGASTMYRPLNPLLYLTRASYATEVERIVKQLTSTGIRQVCVLYQDDAFGKDGLASLETIAKAANVGVTVKASYEKNTTKVEDAVKKIAATDPQAVILIANTAASAEFVKQFRAGGSLAQLIALSVTDGPQVAQKITPKTAHGLGIVQVVPDPGNRTLPISRELNEAFAKYNPPGISVNHTLLEGYLAAKVLVEGLRRAGPNPTSRKLREALDGMRNYDAGGVIINFSANDHAGSRFSEITILNKEGKLLR